jgi:hypothetical protein
VGGATSCGLSPSARVARLRSRSLGRWSGPISTGADVWVWRHVAWRGPGSRLGTGQSTLSLSCWSAPLSALYVIPRVARATAKSGWRTSERSQQGGRACAGRSVSGSIVRRLSRPGAGLSSRCRCGGSLSCFWPVSWERSCRCSFPS